MKKHISNCPVCSSEQFNPFVLVKDHSVSHETYQITACKTCGFKFTQEAPDKESIGKYYESDDYVSHSNSQKGFINWLYHRVKVISLKSKFKTVSKNTHGINIIDYGCGTGDFLKTCSKKGWHIQGYEPNDQAREKANQLNNGKVSPLFELDKYPKEEADIITLWHVLEHIHDLKPTLSELVSKLKSGGTLLIAVPNCSSYDARHYKEYWAAYDVPRHLYHFEPATINELMHQFGLRRKAILPMIFDSFYVSLLSEKYKNENKLGFIQLIKAIVIGTYSNLIANKTKFSSQIYVYIKP